MLTWLYNLFIRLYGTGIRLAAIFSPKARLWIKGRQDIVSKFPPRERLKGCIWFHAASLGEFDQALPLIEAFHERSPETPIVVSFFSPSGYEQRKKFPLAAAVFYLPLDLPSRVTPLMEYLQPRELWVVKYEFWYHLFREASRRAVPVYLLSAVFRPDQPFFRWWGVLHRQMLGWVKLAFVQDQSSLELIKPILGKRVIWSGDTRFDRVNRLYQKALPVPELDRWKPAHPVLVMGSAWEPEMKLVAELMPKPDFNWSVFVVPHEVSDAYLRKAELLLETKLQRWQQFLDHPKENTTLLMDRVGLLGRLYRHAEVALVGGGFKNSLHNILEPATYGIPVIFGPHHAKYPEADSLIRAGGGFEAGNAEELARVLQQLSDPAFRKSAGAASRNWVQSQLGATARVLAQLENNGNL